MKKILILILVAGVISSCYDEFRTDYDHSTVAFSTASGDANDAGVLSRTVVKGEGLELDIGVYLAGVIENNEERWVEYEIDRSLLDGTDYEMMPDDYYTLSNDSRFIIPSGDHVGRVTVDLDSTQFVNDPMAVQQHYAIPFRLTGTSVDSILQSQATKILVVKYMSQYAGFYNQTGSFTTYDASGNQENSGQIDNVIEVTTAMRDSLVTDGLINQKGIDYRLKLEFEENDEVELAYYPNPNPPEITNIALDAQVSASVTGAPGNGLAVINDGAEIGTGNAYDNPVENADPYYGTWTGDGAVTWEWVEYEWTSSFYNIYSMDLFWWFDGGGVQAPAESYVEYWDEDSQSLVEISNSEPDYMYEEFNTVEFDPYIVTNRLRYNHLHGRVSGTVPGADVPADVESGGIGIVEWKVMGLAAATTPEQQAIASVEMIGNGITMDQSTATINMNYRVNYETGGYTDVEAEMVWRNRIRDGVNEWRR